MKPVTYDFDVITDAPAPKRRMPERRGTSAAGGRGGRTKTGRAAGTG